MPNRFNIDGDAVRQLAELLDATGLNEIEYEVEGRRIRVARGQGAAMVTVPQPAPSASVAAGLRENGPTVPSKPATDHPGAVKSPMVGTAYLAPAPGAAPFVKVGDTIAKGETLLIIEAMKVMNPIRAPQAGKVVDVMVKDASPVEFGTVLVILE